MDGLEGSGADERPPAVRDQQDLCLACGLCCTGAWFSHVVLEPDELAPARQAGLQVEVVDGKPRSHQPCALHQGGQCSAYHAWRPSSCANFRCELLRNFADARLNFDEALAHVTAARAMADRLRAEIGPTRGGLCGPEFLGTIDGAAAGTGQPSLSPAATLDAVALTMYYKKYFRRPDNHDGDEQRGDAGASPLPWPGR